MSSTVTVSRTIQFTPPSAPVNSGTGTISTQAIYNSQNVGDIDVQITDASGTSFSIPFGSVGAAKVAIVKNLMSADIGIRINGSVADNFKLPSGGVFSYESSSAPGSDPLSSITVITTATPTQISNISYWVFGD